MFGILDRYIGRTVIMAIMMYHHTGGSFITDQICGSVTKCR